MLLVACWVGLAFLCPKLATKAMRLPKKFGISQKLKVGHCRCPKIVRNLSFFYFYFRKSLTDTTESFENLDRCWYNVKNIPEFLIIDGICQKLTVIFQK